VALHGYCILPHDGAPDPTGISGVAEAEVRAIRSGPLALWVSEGAADRPTAARLREHDRVVRLALETLTPLPLRFGTVFRDEAEAVAALDERRGEFLSALAEVAGKVEMAVRVTVEGELATEIFGESHSDAPTGVATSGRDFLERRRKARERVSRSREAADLRLAEIERDLAVLGFPSARTVVLHEPLIGSVAHLVHRPQLRFYRENVAAQGGDRVDMRFALSGPWAPYSFV
jgi:hypothetical protein